MKSHSRGSCLAIIVLITLTLLAQLPLMLKVKLVEYDEAIFYDIARNIQQTGLPLRSLGSKGVLYSDHTPLYPYFLSIYGEAGVFWGRWITTLFGLGSVLLVYSIGKRLGGRIAGWVSALLLGIHSFFALYSFFAGMEIFCLFFLLAGLRGGIPDDQRVSAWNWLIAGVALAIAVLFKEIMLIFTAIFGVYLLVKFWNNRPFLWKAIVLAVAPSIIALLIWGIWYWHLSPAAFIAVMRRWMAAATIGGYDPRTSLTPLQWAQRIVNDLLEPGLVALWVLALIYSIRHRRFVMLDWILLGYPILAISFSFFVRLKEPRHLIGVLPNITLFIGTKIGWDDLLAWARVSRLRVIAITMIALSFLFSVSPLRLPLQGMRDLKNWFDPLYAWRLFENDRYYNVLRLAGLYLQEHTGPEEIITVVHEATVTAYYANRHYNMLYTLLMEEVIRVLEGTCYLVWDHEIFLRLDEGQIGVVREYVNQHFLVEQVIRDNYREVTIYRRREG